MTGVTQTVRYFASSLGLAVLGSILISENRAYIISTLVGRGLPEAGGRAPGRLVQHRSRRARSRGRRRRRPDLRSRPARHRPVAENRAPLHGRRDVRLLRGGGASPRTGHPRAGLPVRRGGAGRGRRMSTPQPGIFALGTASTPTSSSTRASPRRHASSSVRIASLREPRTTMGGVNLVVGFRPELWRDVVHRRRARRARGVQQRSRRPRRLPDAGDAARRGALALRERLRRRLRCRPGSDRGARRGRARSPSETSSWPYRHDRDLTGFIDGSENPTLIDAPECRRCIPDGSPAPAARSCCCRSGATTRRHGSHYRSPSQEQRDRANEGRRASSSTTGRPTRTSRAPTRTTSARSSAATRRTARSPTTARCSSASAPNSVRSRRCSRTWPG